jgi:hypothetical protein
MIWNGVSNDERLRLWKKLRDDVKEDTFEKKLDSIAKFYASMPFGSRSLDYYSPENWPTPWEILYHGSFCTSSISLLIFYTIILVVPDHKADLYLVEDESGMYLLPVVDDHFVLNYQLGVVSNYLDIKDAFTVKQVFPQGQVKTIT